MHTDHALNSWKTKKVGERGCCFAERVSEVGLQIHREDWSSTNALKKEKKVSSHSSHPAAQAPALQLVSSEDLEAKEVWVWVAMTMLAFLRKTNMA